MKRAVINILALTMCLMLSGCCLIHEWMEADCTTPETCIKCEKTQGEPLGHQWKEATCMGPKTCISCGEISGPKLPHIFGPEVIQNPDYVKCTASYVKTCANCGTRGIRQGELETLVEKRTFIMTPQEFSDRFASMLEDMDHYLGKDRYVSYLSDETMSETLKMYMAKKDSQGKTKIVCEFRMYDQNGKPLRHEHIHEANVLWKVQGTVKGENTTLLAMLSLWRTGDPKNTLKEYGNYLEGIKIVLPPNATINRLSVPYTQHVRCDVTPKGSTSYELSLHAR